MSDAGYDYIDGDKDAFSKQCCRCAHLTSVVRRRCAAFPDGIPMKIWRNQFDHTQAYEGDHGVRFELRVVQPALDAVNLLTDSASTR